jgi:microcin C transport system permease protein
VRDGSRFDVWTSGVVLVGYAIPGFLFAVLLVVLFAGGSFLQMVPAARPALRRAARTGLLAAQALDYAWHIFLPTLALVIGGFAGLTMLTKNSFLDEIGKQYVVTARAKGADTGARALRPCVPQRHAHHHRGLPRGLHRHPVHRRAAGRDHLLAGRARLLGFEAALRRDYPVMFGTLYIFTLLGLVMQIVSDFTYTLVDPRIDFEARELGFRRSTSAGSRTFAPTAAAIWSPWIFRSCSC